MGCGASSNNNVSSIDQPNRVGGVGGVGSRGGGSHRHSNTYGTVSNTSFHHGVRRDTLISKLIIKPKNYRHGNNQLTQVIVIILS